MRDSQTLQHYWRSHAQEDLVLCTIVGKTGSGYRSTGAKKIIRSNGESCGYLSGGCLEGDIIATGVKRWGEVPFMQSFSTMSAEDRLMGYQTGCAGVIDVLFEKLPALEHMTTYLPFGPQGDVTSIAISLAPETLGKRTPLTKSVVAPATSFIDPWIAPFALYVIGCGPNTHVFSELAPALGWQVTFIDYRQGNTLPAQPSVASHVLAIDEIGQAIQAGARTAVVLSTHNYEADLAIMKQLQGREFAYMGCIGPRKRFEQMRDDLLKFHAIEMDAAWASSVHAPAGLHQGRAPEAIAFSILAEIQEGLVAA